MRWHKKVLAAPENSPERQGYEEMRSFLEREERKGEFSPEDIAKKALRMMVEDQDLK